MGPLVKAVDWIDFGMEPIAFVKIISLMLMVFAEIAILILIIMDRIASVMLDFMEIEINALNVIKLVENVLEIFQHNALLALMLVIL